MLMAHLCGLEYAANLCSVEIILEKTPDVFEILGLFERILAISRDSNIALWLRTGKR